MRLKILIYDIGCEGSGITYPLKVAFENIGHDVEMFDWTKFLYTCKNANLTNRIRDRIFFNLIAYNINKAIKSLVTQKRFDLFLVLRGDHIFPETISFAKKTIPSVVNWNSDDIFNKLNNSKYILESFDKYDIHFSPRPHLKEEYLFRGAKAFQELKWYYRLGLLYPESKVGKFEFANSVCFVGAWSKRREYFLSSLNSCDLKVCGWGWNKTKKPNTNWDVSAGIPIKDMMSLFANTKININILTKENRDTTNLRNYEIPAAGAFQLSERSDAILDMYKEDEEIVCFDNQEELISKCKYYLENDSLRNKIAIAGYNKLILGENSLIHRVKQIVEIVNLIK